MLACLKGLRLFILILSLCCAAHADTGPNDNTKSFASVAELHTWANSTWTGASMTKLTYKQHKLLVCFRSYTSGVATSEPFVFLEQDGGRWVRLLTAQMCQCEMEATIKGDSLILWRLDWLNKKKQKTEYLKFNLKTLDTGS